MVRVYFQDEKNICSELVATFASEELYMACLPALEKQAKEIRCIVTESIEIDEVEHAKEVLENEGYSVSLQKQEN